MKTCTEWSTQFDLMYNNIASDKAPGINEYEKSVLLTNAQEAIVVALYKGSFGAAFEANEEVTSYLSTLVKQATCTQQVSSPSIAISSDKSYVFALPPDVLFITLETCSITTGCGESTVPVIPVTQDEYLRIERNPFRKQNDRRVLRLSYATGTGPSSLSVSRYSELISDSEVTEYTVRYIEKPSPIVLCRMAGEYAGLSINDEVNACTCLLPEVLHQTILAEAVRMAKASWNA